MSNAETSKPRDEDLAHGDAGAGHGQVAGVWRILLISGCLAVAAIAAVAALASGG